MNRKSLIRLLILILALLLAVVLLYADSAFAAPVTPNEPLPGCSDVPGCPLVWYVEQDFNGNTGYLVDDLQDPKWRIKAQCQDPGKPAPVRGTECIRVGSRKLDCAGSYQDLIALVVVEKPDKYMNWLPLIFTCPFCYWVCE